MNRPELISELQLVLSKKRTNLSIVRLGTMLIILSFSILIISIDHPIFGVGALVSWMLGLYLVVTATVRIIRFNKKIAVFQWCLEEDLPKSDSRLEEQTGEDA